MIDKLINWLIPPATSTHPAFPYVTFHRSGRVTFDVGAYLCSEEGQEMLRKLSAMSFTTGAT